MTKQFLIAFLFVLISVLTCSAKKGYPYPVERSRIEKATTVKQKLDLLRISARHFYYMSQNIEAADSVTKMAVKIARESNVQSDFIKAVDMYFDYGLPIKDTLFTKAIFTQLAQSNESELQGYGYLLKSDYYLKLFRFIDAQESAQEALSLAEKGENLVRKGLAHYELGLVQSAANNNLEALENFLLAHELLDENPGSEDFLDFNRDLILFYIRIDKLDDARAMFEERENAILLFDERDSIDFVELDFYDLYIKWNQTNDLDYSRAIDGYKFCADRQINFYKVFYLSLYRSQLIENDEFGALYHFYIEMFPEELALISQKDNKADYYRFKAYFAEHLNQIDSADFYWKKALDAFPKSTKREYYSNMLIRYGQFLDRSGKIDAAEKIYLKAIPTSDRLRILPFQLKAVSALERIYVQKGEFQKAYDYAQKRMVVEDSISSTNAQDKLALAKVIHEGQVRQKQQDEQMRIIQLKTNGFAVGFGLFLLLSGLIFVQYRQTNKEKQRSDELLLNILPESTATELKEKGFTTALKYNNATILFSDFVGFTQVAENLLPGELVQELDRYFSAFDKIMLKYGLEKIKTIGDAYMAVGGLPEGNTATAESVVDAALEMQQLAATLNRGKSERKVLNLRLGIHSGEVVAGVVGIKKFQFDIWGDAVNVAARMEQHGEMGKVNISSSTHDLVKNKFVCEYRGKVKAKNKGEMDMYFVSRKKKTRS